MMKSCKIFKFNVVIALFKFKKFCFYPVPTFLQLFAILSETDSYEVFFCSYSVEGMQSKIFYCDFQSCHFRAFM